jgi:hypothetical protein
MAEEISHTPLSYHTFIRLKTSRKKSHTMFVQIDKHTRNTIHAETEEHRTSRNLSYFHLKRDEMQDETTDMIHDAHLPLRRRICGETDRVRKEESQREESHNESEKGMRLEKQKGHSKVFKLLKYTQTRQTQPQKATTPQQ